MTELKQRTVLVADDNAHIRQLVTEYLQASNFRVLQAHDGPSTIKALATEEVDMLVLDINMPGCDGFEVCRQLRKTSSLPVLIMSARSEDLDKILALEMGADDYLTKPFNPRELMARVQATFRRMSWDTQALPTRVEVLNFNALSLDELKRQAWVDGEILSLTPIEFSLLLSLAQNAGCNLTRQQLLDKVWGQDYSGDERTVDAHIRGVRAKLRAADETLRPIVSVWGVGYRFEG